MPSINTAPNATPAPVAARRADGAPSAAVDPGRPAARLALRDVSQAMLGARLLAVAALIVLDLWLPNAAAGRWVMPLLGAAVVYVFGITLYGAQSPAHAERAARRGLAGDIGLLWTGMLITTAPTAFMFLGYPLVVVAALMTGPRGAAAAAAVLALIQVPLLPTSLFAPGGWVGWTLLVFSLCATAAAAGTAAQRLAIRGRFAAAISSVAAAVAAASEGHTTAATAAAVLRAAAAHFRADSGELALFDPVTGRLDVLASQGGGAPALAGPEAGEAIAGWIAQGGRAVLLTPGASFPVRMQPAQVHSSICVASAVAGRPAGVLILHRGATSEDFTTGDLDDAELMAAAAAAGLLRAQNERTLAATLTALAGGHAKVGYALTRDPVVLWPALLDLARSLTAARFAVLALEDEETGNIDIVAARGLNGGAPRTLLGPLLAAVTVGETQRPEAGGPGGERAGGLTCVPLTVGARPFGALGLDLPEDGPLSGPLLTAVVAHIAAAIDTARTAHRVADIGAAEERRRIAREMHDGLAQTLANALLQTDLSAMAAQSAPADVGKELRELRGLLEHAIREMRQFMAELRRTEEGDDRLFTALDALAREVERRHHQAIKLVCAGDDAQLPPAVRHAVLAITRQALANVQRHARATSTVVRAEVTDEVCTVTVADNGIGFDVRAYRAGPAARHHLGLPSMEERAALVGGRLEIVSEPNRGTTVTVQVPLGVRHA